MRTSAALAAVAVVAALAVTGCGGNPEPDVAACKEAMRAQYNTAVSDPNAPAGTRPAECAGVDDATLQRLAGEVMGEALGG